MLLQIDHHSGMPIYRQIIDQLRQNIISGQLPQGLQLMSVRDLAEQLRVNPMTISKAYALLELEGLLERRRGIGLFVAKLRNEKRLRSKEEMLEQAMRKAAAMAVQFEISEDDARQLFARLYRKHNDKARTQK